MLTPDEAEIEGLHQEIRDWQIMYDEAEADAKSANAQAYKNYCDLQKASAARAAAEAEIAELRNRLTMVYGPQWEKHVARRSQP